MNFESFISKFAGIAIEYIRLGNKYFLADASLTELATKLNTKAESIGLYLGKEKDDKFMPSLALLEILAKVSDETVIVNNIGELDFLYKKDIKKRHIKAFTGGTKAGFLKLVINEHNECIGYGKISKDLDSEAPELANMLDRGDFLRRE